ncbi:MAG: hypothetical protein WD355_10835, partial [Balneolaceae bacterium]
MTLFLAVILAVAGLELLLILLVHHYRKQFQWLITKQDELPQLDREGLAKFFAKSYDPELGWVRRPNTTGTERGKGGPITFHIDELGSRKSHAAGEPKLAAFGDSYTFCRQVEDSETWEAYLSEESGNKVLNFGVGNYGADQAVMRYLRTELPDSVDVVVLGFVPETLCRVHSHWKHYLEFGNTFAFKPRYMVGEKGELTLSENPMKSEEQFQEIEELIPQLAERDFFYRRKFRALQFRFPYTASFVRH